MGMHVNSALISKFIHTQKDLHAPLHLFFKRHAFIIDMEEFRLIWERGHDRHVANFPQRKILFSRLRSRLTNRLGNQRSKRLFNRSDYTSLLSATMSDWS